ncbi:MAG TPA: hypothetical protein VHB25_05990 [Gemmatimonadaceae bacterium]|nr:hypothetical protein [Gemmatimonadaceae bacterium]
MNPRRGTSSTGCLFSLLILAAVIYFGANVVEVYWRYYQYNDEMHQTVRFSARSPNDQILARLRATADSLGLPEAAGNVSIRRTAKTLSLESEYYERVELPMYVAELHFHPHAEGPL